MNPTTMNEIIQAVQRARKKHPHFAATAWEAVSLASEELGEFAKAVNEGDAWLAKVIAHCPYESGVRVVGNIHENADLLKEKSEKPILQEAQND